MTFYDVVVKRYFDLRSYMPRFVQTGNDISLPSRTSVFSPSKRHAHKIVIKCPVSKLRLRLRTVETGHSILFAMPLRKSQNLVKAGGKDINFCKDDLLYSQAMFSKL